MYRRGSGWTEEQDTLLTQLWLSGMTAGKIAASFPGRTRNGIIGRVHRLGLRRSLAGTGTPVVLPKRERVMRTRSNPFVPKRPVVVPLIPKEVPLIPAGGVTLMELKSYHCRSVLDARDASGLAMYCGQMTAPGQSFCPYHCKIYHVPPEKRLRRRG